MLRSCEVCSAWLPLDWQGEVCAGCCAEESEVEEEMPTPEGRVKKKVKKILDFYGAFYDMPVPCGYGKTLLDFIGWHHGRAFAIETKAAGQELTPRQKLTAQTMQRHGARVFIIIGEDSPVLDELSDWLKKVAAQNACD